MEIWKVLEDKKRREIWNVFYERFKFNPSSHEKDWPSFLEPTPFKTWFLDNYFELSETASESIQNQLCKLVAYAFKQVSASGRIYILDWQHTCYEVSLNQDFLNEPSSSWKVPIVQDGDYTIIVTEDFQFGYFCHPWEESVCVFGEKFLRLVEKFFVEKKYPLIRQNL